MIGVYFSGTGNTKFCIDTFLREYDFGKNSFSIEDTETLEQIQKNNEIVIGYPVQYSNVPKILRDWVKILLNKMIYADTYKFELL